MKKWISNLCLGYFFFTSCVWANSVYIDVRTPSEYSDGHVPGAVNIDVNSVEFEKNLQGLNKEDTFYLYCRSGRRSASALDKMMKMGFKNIRNLGSISDAESYWKRMRSQK